MNTLAFHPKLSVITVVFNNKDHIERTLLSVINQTYDNIEYIVVDGGSTDGTVDIIRKYENAISKWISEPDNGIYSAMNKGLKMATGDYVLFMNSGDEIYSIDTVTTIFSIQNDADIYYGETELYTENWESVGRRRHAIPETFTWKSFKFGMNVSHQAIYIRRDIIQPYDERYELSADIDWVIKAAKKADKIVNTRQYVAKYLIGGMSKKRHLASLKERFTIFTRHYGLINNVFNHMVILIKLIWHYLKKGKIND